MRPLRKSVSVWVPIIGGAFLMLSEVLLADYLRFVSVTGASLGLIIVGSWQALFLWLLKRKRRFTALRSEIDAFLLHARQLNDIARDAREKTDGDYPQAMIDLKQAMHDSVERMAAVAGVPQATAAAATPKKGDKQRDAYVAVT